MMKVSIVIAVLFALLAVSSLADASRYKCEKRECRCKPGAVSVLSVDKHGCETCTCKHAPTTPKPKKVKKTTPRMKKMKKTTTRPATTPKPTKAKKTTPRKTTPRKTTPRTYCPKRECRCKPGAISVPVKRGSCETCACKVSVLVSGVISDETGLATPGVVVAKGPITVKVSTDVKGGFELLLPPGDFHLAFLNSELVGYDTDLPLSLTGHEKSVMLSSKQTVVPSIEVPATESPTDSPDKPFFDTVLIQGKLVDVDGKSAPGSVVVTDSEGVVVANIPVSANGAFYFSVNVGTFHVAFLNNGNVGFEGDYELIVTGESGSQEIPVSRSVVPKEGAVDPTAKITVSGTLADESGKAVQGFVLVEKDGQEVALISSDANGAFSLELPAGVYQLTFANAEGNAFVDPFELIISGEEEGGVSLPSSVTVVPGGAAPTDSPTDAPEEPTASPEEETTESPQGSGSGSGSSPEDDA